MHIVKRSSEILSFLLILTRPVLLFLNGHILDSVFKNKEMWFFFDESIYYTSSSSPTFQRPLRYEKLRSDQSKN